MATFWSALISQLQRDHFVNQINTRALTGGSRQGSERRRTAVKRSLSGPACMGLPHVREVIGASHQTGSTGTVANLIQLFRHLKATDVLAGTAELAHFESSRFRITGVDTPAFRLADIGPEGGSMRRLNMLTLALVVTGLVMLSGCEDLVPQDTSSLLVPRLHRSEIIGFLAGFGTTFAALPDLLSMLKRRSSAGMNPRMAAIMGLFQLLWVYYGLLIASRPVIVWNILAILINFVSVGAFRYFARKDAAVRGAL